MGQKGLTFESVAPDARHTSCDCEYTVIAAPGVTRTYGRCGMLMPVRVEVSRDHAYLPPMDAGRKVLK